MVTDRNGVNNDAILLKSCFKQNAMDRKKHNCCLVQMQSDRNRVDRKGSSSGQQNIFRKPEPYVYITGLSGLPTRIRKSQYDVYLNYVQYEI